MKLKKLTRAVLIGCTILALGACSSKHKTDASVMDVNGTGGGAMASGVDQGDGFGGSGSSRDALHKRVYYFDFDRSDVRDSDKPAIYANADYLIAHPSAQVIVEGHTDPRGSREYNVALGERRANSVAEMLRSRGVNASQIRVVSYGAERLAVQGRSEEAYQQDRRVVIVYQR